MIEQHPQNQSMINQVAWLKSDYINHIASIFNSWSKSKLTIDDINTHSIVVDFYAQVTEQHGRKKFSYYLKTKSWITLDLDITNHESLIQFCQVHGFFPMVDNIFLDKKNITGIENYQQLYALFVYLIYNEHFSIPLYSEISKIFKTIDDLLDSDYDINDIEQIARILHRISHVATQHKIVFGQSSQRNNTSWVIAEKLYVEVAWKLENNIRDILGWPSTYTQLSSYDEDMNKKTDIVWTLFDKWNNQEFQKIPVQITTSKIFNSKDKNKTNNTKSNKIEHALFLWQAPMPFFTVSVGWHYPHAADKDFEDS